MWRKLISLSLAEHISKIVILFGNMRKVRIVRDGDGLRGDGEVREVNSKCLYSRKFASTEKSGCINKGDMRDGVGGDRGVLRGKLRFPCGRRRSRNFIVNKQKTAYDIAQYPV